MLTSSIQRKRPVFAALLFLLFMGVGLFSITEQGRREQQFSSWPSATKGGTGHLEGEVIFPSRFSQRSIILRLAQKTFVTEPDGRFAIRDIPTGAHRLQLHAIGFEPIQLPLTIKRRKTLVLAPLGLKASRGLVSGRLIDAQQRSLDNLPVRLHPKEITVLTDRDGIFTFRRVPAGSYALVVGNDQQNQTIARRFHLEAGQQFNLGLVSLAPAPPPLASPALSSRFSLLLLASSPPSDSSSAAPASSASSVWLSGIR